MSVVHVNSISGITSITAPSSSDVLTFHSSNTAERVRITSNGCLNIGSGQLDQTDRLLNVYGGRIRISGIPNNSNSFEVYASATTGQSHGILCQAGTNSSDINSTFRNTSGVTLFRVRGDGRVGITTNDPQARLDVYDTSGLGIISQSASTQATDTNKALKIRNNSSTDTFNVSYKGQGYFAGKVGVGIDNPDEKLDVRDGDIVLSSTNAGSAHRTSFIEFTGDYARINSVAGQGSSSASNYAAGWNFTTRNYTGSAFETLTPLTIQASGKIGINSTSPANELIVMTKGGSGHSCAKVVSGNGATALTMQVIQGAEARLGTDSGAPLALYSNGNEFARFQTSGELTLGTTTDAAPDGFASKLQVNSSNHTGSIVIGRHTANANGPALLFNKTRSGSATPSNSPAVSVDDSLGVIRWYGSDGSDRNSSAAQIACVVDGSPGSNDMPGELQFWTTSDGASSSSERMSINKNGQVLMHGTPADGHGLASGYGFYVLGLATSGAETDTGLSINAGNAGATSLIWTCRNTNNGTATESSLYFMKWYYDGNNAPVATKIEGSNCTFGVSGSNTLTITGGAGNFRAAMIWIT